MSTTYSHTENLIAVTATDSSGKPIAWAIIGTRDVTTHGIASERTYAKPMPCHRDGTRIA